MDLQSFIEAVNALKTVTSVRDHKIYSDIRADSNHIIGYKESGLKFDISSHLLYTIFQRNPKTTTNQLKEYIKKWDRSVARAILHSLNKEVNNNQTIIETQIKKLNVRTIIKMNLTL